MFLFFILFFYNKLVIELLSTILLLNPNSALSALYCVGYINALNFALLYGYNKIHNNFSSLKKRL